MKKQWLHKQNQRELIVFCNGWGMDERPVSHLVSSGYDVLMIYDYREVEFDNKLCMVLDEYEGNHLIAWSMGVWAGQKMFASCSEKFSKTIAINGTLCPVDDKYGIPPKIFDATLDGFSEATRLKFYRRMCREKSNLEQFLVNQPKRKLEEQKEELSVLKETTDCINSTESIFNTAVISDNDWIMPTENQKRYWKSTEVVSITGFHYMFSLFQSWQQLIGIKSEKTVQQKA